MENPDYNEVWLFEAKPNKMFPDWMTQRMRFLKYRFPVRCACCGKERRCHWTMTMNFRAAIFGKHFVELKTEPPVHQALTPVCREHPLQPCLPELEKKKTRKKKR